MFAIIIIIINNTIIVVNGHSLWEKRESIMVPFDWKTLYSTTSLEYS